MLEVIGMDERNNETEIVETEEKAPFTPSPRWKRILAWTPFVIVVLGIKHTNP